MSSMVIGMAVGMAAANANGNARCRRRIKENVVCECVVKRRGDIEEIVLKKKIKESK